MALGFASWFLILHLLALHAKGGEAIRSNVIRLNTMDDDAHSIHHHDHMHHDHNHHPSSSSSSIDPQVKVFFLLQDLIVGQVMPIYFPNRHISPSQLLPKQEADKIPFSYSEFPNLLQMFSFSQNSPQAKAMESTLKECQVKPIKGETKICATSLESAHEFAHETFGFETRVKTLTTTHLTKNSTIGLLQNYKVIEILQNIPSPKMVACHTLPYPYAVFYCHSQKSENKVVMVLLEGEDGDLVEALGVCHMDTSLWNREHVSFRVLGVEPGTTPVCHFFPSDNFVLLPFSATM